MFDRLRHAEFLHLPIDWPRINQFPEWFVVREADTYALSGDVAARDVPGREFREGLEVEVTAGAVRSLRLRAVASPH